MRMKDVETVSYVDLRASRDLRGPVLGLSLLLTGERIALTDQPLSTVGSDPACDVVVVDDSHCSRKIVHGARRTQAMSCPALASPSTSSLTKRTIL